MQAAVKRTEGPNEWQEHMVYEFKVVPYDNYGGFNSTTSVQTDLFPGKVIGFDVCLDVFSLNAGGAFGMLSPNLLGTSKSYDVRNFATVTCE
jgi:hypothetical protein